MPAGCTKHSPEHWLIPAPLTQKQCLQAVRLAHQTNTTVRKGITFAAAGDYVIFVRNLKLYLVVLGFARHPAAMKIWLL